MATIDKSEGEYFLGRFVSDPPLPIDFELAVPSGFSAEPVLPNIKEAHAEHLFRRIAKLIGQGPTPPEILVDVAMLPRESLPGALAQVDLRENGIKILQRTDGADLWHQSSRIVGEETKEGARWFLMSRVIKNGVWVFRVTAREREDRLMRMRRALLRSIDSFRSTSPEEGRPSEPLRRFRFQSPVNCSFMLPTSWNQIFGRDSSEIPEVQFNHAVKGVEAGRLCVQVFTGGSLIACSAALRRFSRWVKGVGVHLCGSPILKVSPPQPFTAAYKYQPIGFMSGTKADVMAWAMEHRIGVVLVGLIGPFRDAAPMVSSINRRAHDLIRGTFEFD